MRQPSRHSLKESNSGAAASRRLFTFCLAAAFSSALAGCVGFDGDLQHGYVMDENLLSQVRVGSSAEQVLAVLGSPTTTSTVGGSAWYYISQKSSQALAYSKAEIVDQRVYAVYFDGKKKVERIANYGVEDGRVVDLVTRTTPTAGAEQSFLKNAMKNLLKY